MGLVNQTVKHQMVMTIYHETNAFLEKCFHSLEAPVPAPTAIKQGDGFILRYKEEHQCLELAIVQKLARYISGLNASLLLLDYVKIMRSEGKDPIFTSTEIKEMVNEMLEQNRGYLPQFTHFEA